MQILTGEQEKRRFGAQRKSSNGYLKECVRNVIGSLEWDHIMEV